MKQRNSTTTLLLALFVPFYTIYWSHETAKIVRTRAIAMPSTQLLLLPLVVVGLGLIGLVTGGLYNQVSQNNSAIGGVAAAGIVTLYVSVIASAVGNLIYYWRFSGGIETLTQHQLSRGILFIFFWVFNPVAIYLVQERINAIFAVGGPNPDQPTPFNPVQ